jgi:hypothetical protein
MAIAKDNFESYALGLDSPADHVDVVTPSDTDELLYVARCLWISGDGNLKVTTAGGEIVTFNNVTPGNVPPVRVRQVWATGTTATGILALR